MASECADASRSARTRASRSRCRRSCTSLISSSGMRQLLVRVGELRDADDLALLGLELALQLVGGIGDLSLRESRLEGANHATHLVDLADVGPRALLGLVGERLDEVGAAERVDGVGHARLLGQDLLLTQGEQRGILARNRPRLVVRIGVERLGSAEDPGQRLDRDPGEVVERLLRGERDAGGLGVEAHPGAALVLGAEALAAELVPDAARGPELRDLLEEVVVAVEEEARGGGRSRRSAGRARARPRRRRCHRRW